jgi:hypothetical protein
VKTIRVTIGTIILLVLASLSLAQNVPGTRKDDIVIGSTGQPVNTPLIRVCLNTATGTPCNALASIFSDPGLTQPIANPFPGDHIGNYHVYAAPGRYKIQITGTGIIGTSTFPDVLFPNDPLSPIFNNAVINSTVSFVTLSATPTTNPPLGQVFLYAKNNNNVYILNSSGVETQLTGGGGGGGSGTVTSVGLIPPPNIFSVVGSPITTSGNFTMQVAGTSGGVPFFNTGSSLQSSPQLTSAFDVVGGGAGAPPHSGQIFDNGTTQIILPTGATILQSAIYKQMGNAGSGTIIFRTVCENTSGLAAICSAGVTNGVTGVAAQGAGTSGSLDVCIFGRCQVFFDNQTAILHWAIPSATTAGNLHDTGSFTPTPGVQNFLIDSINAGTGTTATINLGSPDSISNSSSGGGSVSGTVNTLAKFVSTSSVGNSLWTDNGTTATYFGTGGISIPQATFTGAGPFAVSGTEGATGSCPALTSGQDILCWSSTFHALALSNNGGVYLQVAQLPIPASGLTAVNKYRTCMMVVGANNGSALVDADIGPQGRLCFVPTASTIVEVTVAADGGTPNVLPDRNHAGTKTNLVSSALATAAAGGLACSNTGGTLSLDGATTCTNTLNTTSLSAGDWLELNTGATAGGTAKRMSISVTFLVN